LKKGASEENARVVAKLLVNADLAGHDSHGVYRIPSYVKFVEEGKVNPTAKGVLEVDRESVGLFNGEWGFGQVVATEAMKLAIKKGREYGTSAVGIMHSGHIGRMADYCLMAVEEDMIGMIMANANPWVAPFGGAERIFNPCPFGIGIPAGKQRPFVLDISMSVCAAGKIQAKKARNEKKLPEGWIIDKDGNASTNIEDFFGGGSILPLGGSVAYKGYGLAFMIDILAGALTGHGCGSTDAYRFGNSQNGVFMIAVDISRFRDIETFKMKMDEVICRVKKSKKAPGVKEIMIPGEPESLEEEKRLRDGILIPDTVWHEISDVASRLGVTIPLPLQA